ncbi:hypothetical protein EYF80_050306 [Liparis tanakae]|uniref:Uncharacterized protein n=1 Tax=Liparis tanakae TaxID=230148 RepID=A0A4Z2FF69_9TELE|nr:hypothetical protein EYF80_050306 [Liparis tanakae]
MPLGGSLRVRSTQSGSQNSHGGFATGHDERLPQQEFIKRGEMLRAPPTDQGKQADPLQQSLTSGSEDRYPQHVWNILAGARTSWSRLETGDPSRSVPSQYNRSKPTVSSCLPTNRPDLAPPMGYRLISLPWQQLQAMGYRLISLPWQQLQAMGYRLISLPWQQLHGGSLPD